MAPSTNQPDKAIQPGRLSSRLTQYGLLASLLCLLISGAMWLWQSGTPLPTAEAALGSQRFPALDVPPGPLRITKPIEDLRLGDWVLAKNPQLELEEPAQETDVGHPENLRALTLRLPKGDGAWLDLELLRTAQWVRENERNGQIYVVLEELGIDGWADLLAKNPCPTIATRPHPDCRLVTGRFIHQAADAFDLTVVDDEGTEQTKIGVTGNHPFWSEDRQDFARVDTLEIGEHLRDTQGNLLLVGSIEPRAGPEQVYNLEVDVEHVYFVSAAGVLVHNSSGGSADYSAEAPPNDPMVTLYHGSPGALSGGKFDLDEATSNKRAGTPVPGVHLTDDFSRAATGYGRGGTVTKVQVPKSVADQMQQMGGPNKNQLEYFAGNAEDVAELNKNIETLPTTDAIKKFFKGQF